jgi:hypothetical protein
MNRKTMIDRWQRLGQDEGGAIDVPRLDPTLRHLIDLGYDREDRGRNAIARSSCHLSENPPSDQPVMAIAKPWTDGKYI